MATKTETVDETPAPVERVEPVETRPRGRGLAIGGIVAAAVLTAGALFGGGVLLGASLPEAHPAPFAEAQHPQGQPPRAEGPQDRRGPQPGMGAEAHRGDRPAPPVEGGSDLP